ncbi:MAG: type II secretion system F family protein [Gammaproteobacteria bacterium]|nr:type II secretion system F family protein [Gammaproteobacteria bacterium]
MRFRIKAIDSGEGVSVCVIDAPSESDARRQIAERGMQVISVARDLHLSIASGKRFPLVAFSQQLVSLLDAGLNLVEAIDTLTEKELNPNMRLTLDQIRTHLFEGRRLSFALEEIPSVFPPLYVSTIRASEKSGAIREALSRYIAYQKKLDELRKKVVSASIYPAVLCSAGLLVTLFLVGYVVPRFSSIYEDLGSDIPTASRLLMRWGQMLQEHGILAITVFVLFVVTIGYVVTRPTFRAAIFNLLTRIPAIGRQLFTYQLARLYRTVGMLLRGGMPAINALKMSSGLLSESLRPRLIRAIQSISEGKSLTEALETDRLTTPVATRMLRVGERSGNMGEMMERIAEFYDDELDHAVDLLTRLIEPVLMLFIGLIIGFVVVLMYFPIFELAGSIQ